MSGRKEIPLETTTCRACRSINHATSVRCLTCGAPLGDAVATPFGDQAPAADPSALTWSQRVAPSPVVRHGVSNVVVVAIGGAALLAWVLVVVRIFQGVSAGDVEDLATWLLVVGAFLHLYWLWMLMDAMTAEYVQGSRVLWFIGIFLLGMLGALLYAIFGRSRH